MPQAPISRPRRLALLALGAVAAPILAFAPAGRAQEPPQAHLWLPTLLSRAPLPTPARAGSPGATAGATATLLPPTTATPSATPSAEPSPRPTSSATPLPSAEPTVGTPACGAIPSFEDGLAPRRELHVSQRGDDAGGDGSIARPFGSLERAARSAEPGTAIRLHAGSYPGGSYLEGLRGTAAAPIWLGGMPGEPRPRIEGGGTALQLSRAAWLVVHDLELSGQSDNGINADDGGAVADPQAAGPLVFRDLAIDRVGGSGNQDCLKLSGIRGVVVRDSLFTRCGGSGSAIDMVGVHQALVARNRFEDLSANAVQVKGGSADVEIRWNRMLRAGERAVNMGGSTGLPYFRPPLDPTAENAEARRVTVLANRIEGGVTPWAFVGCVDCLAAHNTVVEPTRWLMRILQETTSQGTYRFAPTRSGRVLNNIFVFRRGQIRADVNVGAGTAPETFRFQNNLWYALDDAPRSAPQLPVPETGGVVGRDPLLRADGSIPLGSPAVGAGTPGSWVPGDLAGACWGDPPAVGAYEGR